MLIHICSACLLQVLYQWPYLPEPQPSDQSHTSYVGQHWTGSRGTSKCTSSWESRSVRPVRGCHRATKWDVIILIQTPATLQLAPSHLFALALLALLEATLVPYYFPGILCLVVQYFYSISVSEPWRNDITSNICEMVLCDVMHILPGLPTHGEVHIHAWNFKYMKSWPT